MLHICVEPNDWGDARTVDIERLLDNVASHINRELRDPVVGTISVRRAPSTVNLPQTLIGEPRSESYVVQLAAKDRFWSRYAFQFAHEFCHVVIGPSTWHPSSNSWFEETICELASVFVLRRMSERWTRDPPYPEWSSYSPALADYANQRLSAPERTLPAGVPLSDWFSANEDSLRRGVERGAAQQWDAERRNKMAVVAYAILPLFENQPAAWNAVQMLPSGEHPTRESSTRDYLRSWRSVADRHDKHVVDEVMQMLGVL